MVLQRGFIGFDGNIREEKKIDCLCVCVCELMEAIMDANEVHWLSQLMTALW
jgi:hypothetical protein